MAAIGLVQERRIHDQVGRAVSHQPTVDERRLMEMVRRAREVVGRRDDRPPGVGLGLEDPHQVLLGRDVHTGHRLVEQIQVRPGRQRLGEEDTPTLAPGQLPDLAVALCGHADRVKCGGDGVAVLLSDRPTEPDERDAPHHHDIADRDRKCPVHDLGLWHVGDPLGGQPWRRPEDLDRAGERLEQPGDGLQERALAGAVRADDCEQRPDRDLEVHRVQGDAVAVAGGHVAEPDRQRAG